MSSERDRDEVAVGDAEMVLRRAAEIQAQNAQSGGTLREQDVLHMAEELGISRNAVDRALVELRSGALERARRPRGLAQRLWSPPELVCVRTVPGPVTEVDTRLQEFLRSQQFAIRRHFGDELLWKRQQSVGQRLRALFDSSLQKLQGCSELSTSVRATDTEGTVRAVVRLDLGELRRTAKTNAIAGTVAIGGLALGAAALASAFGSLVWLPIGALAAGATGFGFLRSSMASYRKHAHQLEQNVEGWFDALEHERRALPG